MGFADLLIQMGIPYDSKEAVKVAHDIMGCINDTADDYSRVLGAERGEYPFCEKPEHRGRRNATVTTIAPTGTISMIAGCSSGIEPLFALAYVKNVMDNTPLVETNAAFEATAKALGFNSDELMRKVAEHGGIHDMDEVPVDVRKVFVTSHDIVPHWHVAIQAAFQSHVENSVSKTINLANSATRTDVREAYEMAWKTGCKGITIYRDGCKDTQVLYTGTKDPNKKPEVVAVEGTPEVTVHIHPRKRPGVLHGETQKVGTGCGNLYVTVNQAEGRPVEVFAQMGKSGGCATAQTQAITRLASIALRAGVDSREIADQLTGIRCPAPQWDSGGMILSCPDGIGKVLDSLSGELPMGDKDAKLVNNSKRGDIVGMCPDCGHVLEFAEGCSVCKSCGFSKCGG
jgi:ribonucleoside-diphosphate reductase alpha chain